MKILIVEDDRAIATALAVALNSELTEGVVALNCELCMPEGMTEPPAELMLIPPGPRPTGRDGRSWNNPNPAGVIDFMRARGLDIPIDIEHATELKAPKGEAAPAMAWVKPEDLEVREGGAIWGRNVRWNPKGTEYVMNREYRYYSPAIVYDVNTMNILGIKSVGLTNTPNFSFPALNRSQDNKGATMELAQLLESLGLPAGTTFAAALNHIAKMKTDHATALNQAQNPPLDRFVPRADYDTALNRATTAETSLKTMKDAQLETAINTEIDAALAAGKITPATRDYHVAQCRQEGGLDRFKAYAAAAPVVAGATGLDGKKVEGSETALNAEALKIADMFGNSVEDLKKYGA
jgi:phage I-like protein